MRTPLPDGATDASVPTPEPPAPAIRPGAHRWFVALLILGGLGLATFVTVQVLRVLGFDTVAAFRSPAPPLSMTQLPAAAPAPPAGVSSGTRPAGLGPVRDHPPAVTTPKPQFTLRDGVPDSFLTDLDAETLARLDTLNGRLDALVTATEQANAAGRHLTGTVVTQLAALTGRQDQAQADWVRVMEQLTILQAEVRDLRAALARTGFAPAPPAPAGRPVAGWRVTALNGDRAWLKGPTGQTASVVAGDRLGGLGTVQRVDTERRLVVLSDGRFVR